MQGFVVVGGLGFVRARRFSGFYSLCEAGSLGFGGVCVFVETVKALEICV